jgi:hypothetical protein
MSMPWAEFKPWQFNDLTYLDLSLDTPNIPFNKIFHYVIFLYNQEVAIPG